MTSAPRTYRLGKRAELQEETRRRITRAAVELHTTLGPAQTSIKAIAEHAGVQRHTVYRHFPTLTDLFAACSAMWEADNPFPDPREWSAIADGPQRLRAALGAVYAHYRSVEPDLTALHGDIGRLPELTARMAETDAELRELAALLAGGWSARGRRRRMLLAAIGLALQFPTWRALALDQGLSDAEAAELMTGAALAAAAKPG